MEQAHETYTAALLLAPPLLFLRKSITMLGELRVALLVNRAAACLALGWLVPAALDASSAIAEVTFVYIRSSANPSPLYPALRHTGTVIILP
jgi:hypothetical protein